MAIESAPIRHIWMAFANANVKSPHGIVCAIALYRIVDGRHMHSSKVSILLQIGKNVHLKCDYVVDMSDLLDANTFQSIRCFAAVWMRVLVGCR